MHLTGPDLEVEPVDCLHPPKLSDTCSSVKAPASGAAPKQRPEQVGSRDDRAVALERAAVLEIEDLGNSAGNCEHDDEQQYRIEKCRHATSGAANSGNTVKRIVPSSGPRMEPRPPTRMAMKNRIDRSSVNASGVM